MEPEDWGLKTLCCNILNKPLISFERTGLVLRKHWLNLDMAENC